MVGSKFNVPKLLLLPERVRVLSAELQSPAFMIPSPAIVFLISKLALNPAKSNTPEGLMVKSLTIIDVAKLILPVVICMTLKVEVPLLFEKDLLFPVNIRLAEAVDSVVPELAEKLPPRV